MFYSHEILTSRQHGVATVWLVATLGSKSSLKKITRKAILDVDVPKACETIQDPQAPMALRLQGNLLYGVSRVYSQQCGYVLADTQTFRDKMKGVAVIMKEMELDPEAGRARPDQLNLPNDPAFIPELDMAFDTSMFDISDKSSRLSSLNSPRSRGSSRSSLPVELEDEPVLEFSSADMPSGSGLGGFGFAGGTSSVSKPATKAAGLMDFLEQETGIIQADFEFDGDGNLVDLPPPKERAIPAERGSAAGSMRLPSRPESDSGISAQVRAEHEGGRQGLQPEFNAPYDDDGILILGDEDEPLPPAEPFSPRRRLSATPDERGPQSSSARPDEETSSSAAASQRARKPRTAKSMQIDQQQTLQNADLKQWKDEYLANMAQALKTKEAHKTATQAKKNALFWVFGQGIAGVGRGLGQDHFPSPLDLFSGQALLDALTGKEPAAAGRKRTRSRSDPSGVEDNDDARRVRARTEEEEQVGRGGEYGAMADLGDDEGIVMGDDMDIEIGRHAPQSLPDVSSQMPWNVLASSRHGSARPFGSGMGGPGISSSAGGVGIELGPPSALAAARARSRFTSASPLVGRGPPLPRYSSVEIREQGSAAKLTSGDDFDEGFQLGPGDDDQMDPEFELYGPAAKVDTQTAQQSQWIAAALDTESHNFLDFIVQQIEDKVYEVARAGEWDPREVDEGVHFTTFQEMLDPDSQSKVVGAQGILHVLTLATKGLIEVVQEEAFGEIEIRVAGGFDVEPLARRMEEEGGEGEGEGGGSAGEADVEGEEGSEGDVEEEL